MKHIFNKIFILLLLCILPSTSKGEMLQGIMVEDGRISGIVTALFGKGTEYETTHNLQIDCSVPNRIYTPEIFEVEYRYFSKKDIQKALQAIGQSDQGTFQNSREGTSYVNTSKIDPSAGISKEDAAKQAIDIGIKYFEALGIEVVPTPVHVERPYDFDAYMEHNKEVYSHRYSDTTTFMERAKIQWEKTRKYETRSAAYTQVTFAVMVNGMRLWTQPSYPAGYKDEPDARIGFEISASVLVSDSGILIEASTSHIPQVKKIRQLKDGENEFYPSLQNELHFSPLIRAESWQEALNIILANAGEVGNLSGNAEDEPFQNQYMDEPITKFGYQTVITEIYPCLSTITKDEWTMFWHIHCQQQYADGWRY